MNARVSLPSVGTSAHDANAQWAEVMIDVLHAHGVRRAILSPGGRSAALILAMRASGRFTDLMICNDERSGAFAAVGMLKVSPEPVVMVTTSGSAIANTVPALTEAFECGLPLVLVSCDRPRAMRGAGFGQMTDHIGACAAFVRHSVDLPDPVLDATSAVTLDERRQQQARGEDRTSLHALRVKLEAALRAATACDGLHAPGPVHINMPLAGRYDPTEIALEDRVHPTDRMASANSHIAASSQHATRYAPSTAASATDEAGGAIRIPDAIAALCRAIRSAQASPIGTRRAGDVTDRTTPQRSAALRGLVIAGPDVGLPHQAVLDFVATLGWPVLADTGSGLRGSAHALNGHDALALSALVPSTPPDLIIRLGLAPVMPIVQDYLLAQPCPTIKLTPVPVASDFLHPEMTQWVVPRHDAAAHLRLLADTVTHLAGDIDTDWHAQWRHAAMCTTALRERTAVPFPWGELPAMQAIFSEAVTQHFAFMHIGNSMPIRHADLMFRGASQRPMPVHTNRGVCGIDGTIGAFLGEVIAHQRCAEDARSAGQTVHADGAGLLVLGDQSFLHDLPALSNAQRVTAPACICVINNAGGAIFDFLPLARLPDYQAAIRNPTTVDVGSVAAGFGLAHRTVRSIAALNAALHDAAHYRGVMVLDVCVPAHSAALAMRELAMALQAANQAILGARQRDTSPTSAGAIQQPQPGLVS